MYGFKSYWTQDGIVTNIPFILAGTKADLFQKLQTELKSDSKDLTYRIIAGYHRYDLLTYNEIIYFFSF